VDTTCGSVVAVWKRVERYAREGFTAIIHGKYAHEETRATSSQASKYGNGKYLIVLNHEEAGCACRYIVEGGNRIEFLQKFEQACSPGFDPDIDLQHVGLANQTTMLSGESLEIAEMFREAIEKRYGKDEVPNRFRHFDTICSATQDRQDAVNKLVREDIDLMIVIGGYNSSNTTHLCEISSMFKPTYHIDDADCIISATRIRHKPVDRAVEVFTDHWLGPGQVTLGFTAGASTPDRVVGEVIDRVAQYVIPG
jgi:4-hydroxy-3-methylbut-2-enyl diphosphate reductase